MTQQRAFVKVGSNDVGVLELNDVSNSVVGDSGPSCLFVLIGCFRGKDSLESDRGVGYPSCAILIISFPLLMRFGQTQNLSSRSLHLVVLSSQYR